MTAHMAFGEPVEIGSFSAPRLEEEYRFVRKFVAIMDDVPAQGKIKVHPPQVMEGALEGVVEGLYLLRNNKVSGQKLVYCTILPRGAGGHNQESRTRWPAEPEMLALQDSKPEAET